MDWKLDFKPDSAGGHLACLLARQVGSLPVGIGSEAYLPRSGTRISSLSFRAEPVRLASRAQGKLHAVEESLGAPDFRKAVRA